jgi:exopolysaccharide biosynthesis polyprenyl glycosylphosphotransferase
MRVFGKALPPKAATLLGTNIVLLGVCVPAVLALHGWSGKMELANWPAFVSVLVKLVPVSLFYQMVLYYHELYNLQIIRKPNEQVWRLLRGTGIAMLVLAVVYALMPQWSPGRDALLGLTPCLMAVVVFTRLFALTNRRVRVAIIGPEQSRDALTKTINECSEWNMDVIESYEADSAPSAAAAAYLDRVIVCAETPRSPELIDQLIDLKMHGIRVESAARFFEQATGRVYVDEIRPEWFVFSSGFENGRRKRLLKRAFDLSVATVMLILSMPFMLLAALVIVAEGKGPVFFHQDRVGLHGKVFSIFKFRTMVTAPSVATPQWTLDKDKRITRVGRFMRTFRIDELPQLLNVLRGEMTLVGPRPEQPYFCDLLAREIPYYHQRHTIPPGLTGWAQVRYQYGASIEESKRKLEFDLFYVKHLSIWLDLAILFETLKVVLVGRGAK